MSKFDFNKALDELQCPEMFKAGFNCYISSNNIKVNNQKEFDKLVKEFGNMKIGG